MKRPLLNVFHRPLNGAAVLPAILTAVWVAALVVPAAAETGFFGPHSIVVVPYDVPRVHVAPLAPAPAPVPRGSVPHVLVPQVFVPHVVVPQVFVPRVSVPHISGPRVLAPPVVLAEPTVILGNGAVVIVPRHVSPRAVRPAPFLLLHPADTNLPLSCLQTVSAHRGDVQAMAASCLIEREIALTTLPHRCWIMVPTRPGIVRGFDPICLGDAGYRLAGR